jgi:hypothetical protein
VDELSWAMVWWRGTLFGAAGVSAAYASAWLCAFRSRPLLFRPLRTAALLAISGLWFSAAVNAHRVCDLCDMLDLSPPGLARPELAAIVGFLYLGGGVLRRVWR